MCGGEKCEVWGSERAIVGATCSALSPTSEEGGGSYWRNLLWR